MMMYFEKKIRKIELWINEKKFRFCCKSLHGFDFFMSLNSDLYIVPNIKIRKVTKT